ncbi:MAG: hypothetical protein AAF270_15640 [Pseudomonadota bacterium]
MPLGAVERRQLEDVANSWYSELGDAKQRKYWPYRSLDERILIDMAAQGDAEAMLQLGLNKLWRATRVSGSKWPMNPEQVVADTPRREPIDAELFTSAEVDLHNAAVNGKIFALRQLVREYEFDPAPLMEFIAPGDPMPLDDAINAHIASYHLFENYVVDSPITSVDLPLSDEARMRAERFAKGKMSGVRFFRQKAGYATEKVVVPDAVLMLMANDTCQR